MSSERLARLVEFGGLNNMDSLLVTRHGRIVLEATYAPFRAGLKHRINSATKSVISTLVAMAMRDGRLDSTDRRVMEFFADRTIANLDDAKKAITIRHLLDMTSGLEWSEGLDGFRSFLAMERSPDWQQFVLDRPMSEAPGTRFYYDSGNSHLLSAILTKVTGKSALDYAREVLFGPLGIEDVMWRADPQGHLGRRCRPLHASARHGEDRLSLPARRRMGRKADPAGVMDRGRAQGGRRHARDLGAEPALRQPVLGDAGPRRLHGGRLRPSADRCHPQARHRGGDDRLGTLRDGERLADQAALQLRFIGQLPDLRRLRRCAAARRSRGDGRARAKGEGGHYRAAGAGRRSAGDGQDDLRQDMAVRRPTTCGSSPSPSRSTAPSRPSNTRPTALQPARRRASAGRSASTAIIVSADACATAVAASRARWLDDGTTLVLETQTLGNDDLVRATHVFGDKTVEVKFEMAIGFKTTADRPDRRLRRPTRPPPPSPA